MASSSMLSIKIKILTSWMKRNLKKKSRRWIKCLIRTLRNQEMLAISTMCRKISIHMKIMNGMKRMMMR